MRKLTPLLVLFGCSLALPVLGQDAAPGVTPAPGAKAASVSASAAKDHQAQLVLFQERIADLTRRIELAEGRAGSLKGSAMSGKVGRTHALIVHKNEMGRDMRLSHVTYILDGRVILDRDNADDRLSGDEPLELFNGPIQAGDHVFQAKIVVRGQAYGPFTYLEGYKFTITSKSVFQIVDGQSNQLVVAPRQKDDITLEPKDRMTIEYRPTIIDTRAAKSAP